MPIVKEAESLIKNSEGLRLEAYLCPAGKWTIGYGSRTMFGRPVVKGLKITLEQAQTQFNEDVEIRKKEILKLTQKPLNENQLGALVSLVYNIGISAFASSTLLKKLNLGDYVGAADQFLAWNKITVDGKLTVSSGLTSRRVKERTLFLKGVD